MLEYDSIAAICEAAEQQQVTISALVLSDQAEQTEMPEEALYERMKNSLYVMQEAVREGKNPDLRSTSGLTGGDAARMEAYAAGGGITGTFLNHAMARAVAVQCGHGQDRGVAHSRFLRDSSGYGRHHAGGRPVR